MKKVTKVLLGVAAALVVAVVALIAVTYYYMTQGPDLSKYEHLKNPQIVTAPDQKMIVVEAKGDPNVAGSKAFATLFQVYFKTKRNGWVYMPCLFPKQPPSCRALKHRGS
ncbi:hypothetical protein HUU39_03380 [candidate division KSB1 bacterium]|nr:hypothetical protein [candidate division KSB1 bacterium]